MSKRVYEIAREQSLDNKEVLQRLQDAGVDVKSHSSSVDENVYERVFGDGDAPNGRTEAQEAEAQEARAEAEQSGHNATIAQAPAEEPISMPRSRRPEGARAGPGGAGRPPGRRGRARRARRERQGPG